MKNSLFHLLSIAIAIMLIVFSFAGCGAATKENNYATTDEYVTEEYSEDVNLNTESNTVKDNRKIIENINLSVQTKEFDKLIDNLNKQITKLGGYIESSETRGREYDSYDTRNAEYTVRIPSDKSGSFTEYISQNSVIINKSITTEDVTLKYVDMESRVKVLEAEKTALENLLKSAASTSEIIEIREKLTNVIGDIESYKSQLRTYDNLVSFSTVSIFISEVERTAVVEKQNIWQKIGTNLKNNFSNVWNIIVNLFVFIVSIIPYLIPIAIIVIIVVIIIKLRKKKSNKF